MKRWAVMADPSDIKAETTRRYYTSRSSDPDLTKGGYTEARLLGDYLCDHFRQNRKKAIVFSSPFSRAILTARPLALRLNQKIKILPEVFEAYGSYRSVEQKDGKVVHKAAETLSRQQILDKFDCVGDVSLLPEKGGWYTDSGREQSDRINARVKRVAKRLLSMEFSKELNKRVGVIVSHGTFLDLIIRALLNGVEVVDITKREGLMTILNTSIIRVRITHWSDGKVDSRVVFGSRPHVDSASETSDVFGMLGKMVAVAGFGFLLYTVCPKR
ncbi:hypothetical protein AAMO2058_001426400 [Amorphochlora amoebiformis]